MLSVVAVMLSMWVWSSCALDRDTATSGKSVCTEFSSSTNNCIQWEHSFETNKLPPGCFPGTAVVRTMAGEPVKISEVKVGDRILSLDAATHRVVFARVKAWLHVDSAVNFSFVRLNTDRGAFDVSPYHNVAINDTEIRYSYANAVAVHDRLITPSGDAVVQSIGRVYDIGVYAPLTDNSVFFIGNRDAQFLSHSFAHIQNPQRYEPYVHAAFDAAAVLHPGIHADVGPRSNYIHPVAGVLYQSFGFLLDGYTRDRGNTSLRATPPFTSSSSPQTKKTSAAIPLGILDVVMNET